MLDYDTEAGRYDATRGGAPRAEAAAGAVLGLVPGSARTLLDLGCGTGLVTERYARPGRRLIGADASAVMASTAARRLGGSGSVVRADCRRLPFADASVDAVTAVWLLHMIRDAAAVVAECARVLRPGGLLVLTVDKDAAYFVGSDIDALLAPYADADPYDGADAISAYAAEHGLRPAGEAAFTGHGQGRTPLGTVENIRGGRYTAFLAFTPGQADHVSARLAALPAPQAPRPDPVYRLLALRKPSISPSLRPGPPPPG